MRKVIFLIHMSLDGFTAGLNGEMDWITYNEDMVAYSHEMHEQTDTAIYGRVTFQMMESYYPNLLANPADGDPNDLRHAQWLDNATKIVFSRTLQHTDWRNTRIIRDNIAKEINNIKQQEGKDMWLLGSPTLAQTFMKLGLIDEYRINLNPVVLGSGKRLFSTDALNLKIVETKTFEGGVVGLKYVPA